MSRYFKYILIFLIACSPRTEESYFDTGEKKTVAEVDSQGRKHGVYREFYKSGDLKLEIDYKEGLENGTYKEYSPNGDLAVFGLMRDGNFVRSEGYDSSGILFEKRHYSEGKVSFVEKFNKEGKRYDHFVLPMLSSDLDTVLLGNEHCLTVRLCTSFNGQVKLTIGHVHDNATQKLDTVLFTGNSYTYCIKASSVGENQIRGFFEHMDEVDTTTIDNISFKHSFYVKDTSIKS